MRANAVQSYARDFGPIWFAGRSILHGVNPYPLVGPERAFTFNWPLVYPLTAGVAAIPLTPLPMSWASVVFSAIGGACFAYALLANGYAPLLGFFGIAIRNAAETAQWSPLFAASLALPPLAFLLAAKPIVGAAYFIAWPSKWAAAGAVILAAIAFAVVPGWLHDWIIAVTDTRAAWYPARAYTAPIQLPGGALALLCLLRWRRPEARIVAALACAPQSMVPYETVALFLVPRSWSESATLAGLSYLWVLCLAWRLPPAPEFRDVAVVGGPLLVALLYVPATIMVLRRPNEGQVPGWLERLTARWPVWLRGVERATHVRP